MKRFSLKMINDKMWLIKDAEGSDIMSLQECVDMLNELSEEEEDMEYLNIPLGGTIKVHKDDKELIQLVMDELRKVNLSKITRKNNKL